MYVNVLKTIHDMPPANINFSGKKKKKKKKKKLKTFLLRPETRQGCLLLPPLFNTVLKVLAIINRQE